MLLANPDLYRFPCRVSHVECPTHCLQWFEDGLRLPAYNVLLAKRHFTPQMCLVCQILTRLRCLDLLTFIMRPAGVLLAAMSSAYILLPAHVYRLLAGYVDLSISLLYFQVIHTLTCLYYHFACR